MKSIEEINKEILELRQAGISVEGISDGFHTIGEYKESRNEYFIGMLNDHPEISWKSKKHFDEENDPMFNGCFIAGMNTPEGPITRHIKLKDWDDLEVPEIDNSPEYDGYTQKEDKKKLKSLRKTIGK